MFGVLEGFDGLALAASDDKPVVVRCAQAIKDGLGGAGEVLAGLARPEADLELGSIGEPVPLVREEDFSSDCSSRLFSEFITFFFVVNARAWESR